MNDADSRKLQEVLNWYRQTKGKMPQPRQVQYPRLVGGSQPRKTKIKNDTPNPWVQGRVLEIVGVVETPTSDLASFKTDPVLLGATPQHWANTKKYVILAEDIAAGAIGECFIDGLAPALIDSSYKTNPSFAHPSDGNVYLDAEYDQSNYGWPIMYRETGTGLKWGLINMTANNAAKSVKIWFNFGGGGWAVDETDSTPAEFWSTSVFITKNTLVRTELQSDGLYFDGPSSWFLTWEAELEITHEVLGGAAPRSISEAIFTMSVSDSTWKYNNYPYYVARPDNNPITNRMSAGGSCICTFGFGLFEDTGAKLCVLLSGSSADDFDVVVKTLSISMIEIDPVGFPTDDPQGEPTISLSPTSFTRTADVGTSPSNDTFTVTNSGTGTLSYTITDNQTWLSCSPTSGTGTGEADTITITYSTAALGMGTHNATITVTDSNATNSPQTIAVTVNLVTP